MKKISHHVKIISTKEAENLNIGLTQTQKGTPNKDPMRFEELKDEEEDIFEHGQINKRKSEQERKNLPKKDYNTDVPTMGTDQFVKNQVPEFREVKVKSKLEEGGGNHNLHQPTVNSQSRLEKQTADRRQAENKEDEEEGESASDFGDIEFADVSDEE